MSSEIKEKLTGLSAFWAELKRRKVMRVAITYAVVAWLIIQIAEATFENFGIPVWAFRFVTLMVLLGFPIALIMAWAFELTPEGIKTTKNADEERGDGPVSVKQQRKRNWTAYAVGAVLPSLIFGILATVFYLKARSASDELVMITSTLAKVENDKSIAVLPLDNLSPDPDHAYFTDAIHGEILNNLGNISDLRVIPVTSVRQYRNTLKTARQIGDELGVRFLVEGNVFRDQNRAAISLKLIDAQTERQTWAESYDRSTDELFTIRSAVAMDVAKQLHAVLSPEEEAQISEYPTENREAYDLFLRAWQTTAMERISLLSQATELDPDYVDAWRDLGWFSMYDFIGRGKTNTELLAHTRTAVEQVKRIEPDSPWSLGFLAGYELNLNHNLEAALQYRQRSHTLGGTGADLGLGYLQWGQLEKAKYYLEQVVENNPVRAVDWHRLNTTYLCLGMWDQAHSLLERYIELEKEIKTEFGEETGTRILEGTNRLLIQHAYLQSGDQGALVAAISDSSGFMRDPWGKLWNALILRDYAVAVEQVEEISSESDNPKNRFTGFQWVGMELIFRGQIGRSLDIEPISLLSALIHFAEGNKEKWLEETAKAKAYWEESIAVSYKVDPNYYAALAICHALEGDREQMEFLIPKIRELTETVNWQFRAQAECEVKLAIAYLALGDENKALDLLEKAKEVHSPMFINRELQLWFIFDRLKGNPRFDALLAD